MDIPHSIKTFVAESKIPLVLSDSREIEDPLIMADDAFCEMSGFARDGIIGRNCRFMHGPGTQQTSRNIIRGDFAANRDTAVLVRNYRKNGEVFDNFLHIFTLMNDDGRAMFRLGAQFPIPAKDRAKAFVAHIRTLLIGLQEINASGDLPAHRLIEIDRIRNLSAISLLDARLGSLKGA